MRTIRILLTIFLLAPLPAFAQHIHIPDPNLRAAISEELDGVPVTRETMLQLTELDARERGITDLTGLEYAHNLRSLMLVYNNISDLTPISDLRLDDLWLWDNLVADLSPLANMRSLTHLDLGYNQISDISPLEKLTRLEWLELSGNQITDITTLSNLTQLTLLEAFDNAITDVTPLAGLTRLEHLRIQRNLIFDFSPLDGLSLDRSTFGQICDMPPLPLKLRLENRQFPSLVSQWEWPLVNKPHVSKVAQIAKHNLCFACVGMGNDNVLGAGGGWLVHDNDLADVIRLRDEYLTHNPSMIFMTVISALWEKYHVFPEDAPYWLRDEDGQIVPACPGEGIVNLNHPDVQRRIVQKAVAVSRCGLFDGIIFDGWNPGASEYRGDTSGMVSILKAIRERAHPDFLIAANTNRQIAPAFAPYMNGIWLEAKLPADDVVDGEEGISRGFSQMEATLSWAEQNARPPRINAFYGLGLHTPENPLDGPTNVRWMRAVTTLNLTFSDAYFFHHIHQAPYKEAFYWYDFWDADLGRPIGATGQLYQEVEGLYIREFTNGWAVYNHSGEAQVVTLPEEVRSVTGGLSNTKHAVLNLDGDILLNIPPLLPGDINGDGIVNILDLTLVAQGFGTGDLTADVNGDGVVNVFDLVFVANQF